MNAHPLIQFAQETTFDIKKFRDQLAMSIAVSISVYLLKVAWVKFTEEKRAKR